MDTQTVKTCSRCKMEKPVPQYSRNGRNRDGLQNYCKQCHRAWYDAEHKRRFEAALALGHFTCRRCKQTTPVEHVVKSLGNVCRQCHRWKNAGQAYNVLDADGNPRPITSADWDRIFESQGRVCAVCGSDDPQGNVHGQWATDHDHSTGLVRGILCNPCNIMLGFGRDDPSVLDRGAEYLRKSSAKNDRRLAV
jgi:hypothetical protein